MRRKDKSTALIGVIAFATTALFVLKTRNGNETKKIEGLNIDIDPEKMVDNIKPYISDNPQINEKVSNMAKYGISQLLGKLSE